MMMVVVGVPFQLAVQETCQLLGQETGGLERDDRGLEEQALMENKNKWVC